MYSAENEWVQEHEARQLMLAHVPFEEPDGTISVSKPPYGRGSLGQLGMAAAVPQVNALSRVELLAVRLAAQSCPFPLGKGEAVYAKVLAAVRKDGRALVTHARPWECLLSTLRASVAEHAARGINAPTDTYLRIAVEARCGQAYDRDPGPLPVYHEPAWLVAEYRGQLRFALTGGA